MVKNKETDILGYLFRKVTIPLTKFMLRYTSITPNQITYLSIFVMIGGLAFLGFSGFSNNPYTYRLLGAILIFLTYILDHLDGKMARVMKLSSLKGKWLDSMIGYLSLPFIFLSVALGLREYTWLLWGTLAAICFPLQFLIIYIFKYDFDPLLSKRKIKLINKKNKLRFVYGTSTLFVFLPILVALNLAEWILIFFATFGNLFWIVILAMQLRTVLKYDKKSMKNK